MDFIDFSKETYWHSLFYGTPDNNDPKLKELDRWLREHKNDFVRLYHGTSSEHTVMKDGLLPTCNSRKHSLQSRNGFVSLSVFPSMAKTFGEMAYPKRDIEVYAVTLCVRNLVADKDQLANQRQYAEREVKDTLAHSLVFGHGAQVKGKIDPYSIQPMSLLMKDSLASAIDKNETEIVNELLKYVRDVNIKNYSGVPLLNAAICKRNEEVIEALIRKGVDVNLADDHFGDSALSLAMISGNTQLSRLLIDNGANIHHINNEGRSIRDLINKQGKNNPEIMSLFDYYLAKQEQIVLEEKMQSASIEDHEIGF